MKHRVRRNACLGSAPAARSNVARGLRGVKLAISDAHIGLKPAIREVLVGTSWQRCRVHLMRNLLAHVPKAAQAMVAATVRTIFEQPDTAAAHTQLHQGATTLQDRFSKGVALLEEADDDLLAHFAFPAAHRR